MYSLTFSKSKRRRETKKLFLYCLDQKLFYPFWENYKKYFKKSNFEFSFWYLFFDTYRRKVSANFLIKILIFKVPVIFWKWKLCHACEARAQPKLPIFWYWTPKIYMYCSISKMQNNTKSLHATVELCGVWNFFLSVRTGQVTKGQVWF